MLPLRKLMSAFAAGQSDLNGGSSHTGRPSASIRGEYLYSYNTIIGKRYPFLVNGRPVFWITSQKYSVTTSKQQTFARSAICQQGGIPIVCETEPGDKQAKLLAMKRCADRGEV